MTTLEAIQFAANVTIGTKIKASGMVMRVDEIKEDGFHGQSIYKGKDRGLTTLRFEIITNPHYCKDITIID